MRRITILLVALVALGVVAAGGVVSAADQELAGDGTDVIEDYEPDEDRAVNHTIEADEATWSDDGTETLVLNVSYDEIQHYELETTVDEENEASQTVSFSLDDIETVPGGANETTTVNVSTVGIDDAGQVSTAVEQFTVDLVFNDTHAAVHLHDEYDGDDGPDVDIESQDASGFWSLDTFSFGVLGDDGEIDVATFGDDVSVVGAETEVTVHDETSDGPGAFDESIEDSSSGDVLLEVTAAADDEPVFVFDGEPDDDLVDTDDDTYVVYDASDDTFVYHLGGDFEDAEEIDVLLDSQHALEAGLDASDVGELVSDLGFLEVRSAFGTLDTVWTLGHGVPFVGATIAIALVTHRRREG